MNTKITLVSALAITVAIISSQGSYAIVDDSTTQTETTKKKTSTFILFKKVAGKVVKSVQSSGLKDAFHGVASGALKATSKMIDKKHATSKEQAIETEGESQVEHNAKSMEEEEAPHHTTSHSGSHSSSTYHEENDDSNSSASDDHSPSSSPSSGGVSKSSFRAALETSDLNKIYKNLQNGADPTVARKSDNRTALHVAGAECSSNPTVARKIAKDIMNKNSDVASLIDNRNQTPLQTSDGNGCKQVANEIRQHGIKR